MSVFCIETLTIKEPTVKKTVLKVLPGHASVKTTKVLLGGLHPDLDEGTIRLLGSLRCNAVVVGATTHELLEEHLWQMLFRLPCVDLTPPLWSLLLRVACSGSSCTASAVLLSLQQISNAGLLHPYWHLFWRVPVSPLCSWHSKSSGRGARGGCRYDHYLFISCRLKKTALCRS